MKRPTGSLILGAILFVLFLPLFLILVSAFFTFVFVLFWVLVLGYLWKTNSKFQIAVKVLAVVVLFSIIFLIFFRDSDASDEETIEQETITEVESAQL